MTTPQEEIARLREIYSKSPRRDTFNAIIYGDIGTGKTTLLGTCRKPVLIHSFDPGGTTVLRDQIEEGSVIVDDRFEAETPDAPRMARLWDQEYSRLKESGVFDLIGTYAIDSMTTWAQCVMYEVMRQQGRAGTVNVSGQKDKQGNKLYTGVPQQNDWMPQMQILENSIKDFLGLPCDCVLIGHDDISKDDVSGKMYAHLMITGKLSKRVPLLFDEVYVTQTKESPDGTSYYLQTQPQGIYKARSRLSRKGLLDKYEPADIKHILKKVGYSTDDKPLL